MPLLFVVVFVLEKLCFLKNVCDLIYKAIQNISETLCDVFKRFKRNKYDVITLQKDGFYLNNKRIINIKSRIQYEIFKLLVEQHIHNFWNKQETYISSKTIIKKLESNDIYLTEAEINTYFYLIRNAVRKVCNHQIFENKKWHGYRIKSSVNLGFFE